MGKLSIRETNVFYLLFILSYFMLAVIVGRVLPKDAPAWVEFCASNLIVALPMIVLFVVKKINPLKVLEFSNIGIVDFLLACLSAYCLLPVILIINYVTMFFTKNYVVDMMAEVYEYPLVVQLILLALMPAVVEEVLSRGIFYGSYRRRNIVRGALMSGMLFGLMHLNLNQFAYAFFMGVMFCILYEASGNILLPITTHFTINANSVLASWFSRSNIESEVNTAAVESAVNTSGMAIMGAVFIIGITVLGIGIFVLIVKTIAERHNRLELLKNAYGERNIYKEESPGKFFDMYMIAAILPAVLYMVCLEMVGI